MNGIVCKDAFKDIVIGKGKVKGTQIVTFKSTNAKLTKEQAIKAIGDHKDKYVVVSVENGAKKAKKPGKKEDAAKKSDSK